VQQFVPNGTDIVVANPPGSYALTLTVTPVFVTMPGACVPLAISLPSPAPSPFGEYITLTTSDPTTFTFEDGLTTIIADFPAGSTTPSGRPLQVCGVNLGQATISVSGGTLSFGTSMTIITADSLSFAPSSVTISTSRAERATLTLASPAPAGGLTVNLSSDNTSVATVPATVAFPGGSTTAIVTVTAEGSGTTLIHANLPPYVPDTTLSVTVP
jgi:hypothetical protein